MIRNLTGLTFAGVAIISSAPGTHPPARGQAVQPASVSGALAAAASFHAALARGDSAAAEQLLDGEAMIMESGYLETRAEYLARHLAEDIQFAKAVASKRTVTQAKRVGNMAWIVTTSDLKGSFNDKPVDSRGAELMVLSRSGSDWRINAIHWSSRRATSP